MDLSTSRLLLCALLAVSLLAPATAAGARNDEPTVTCTSCLLVDDSGRKLFARSPAVTRPNASTTKMTTALVTLDAVEPDEEVLISAGAAATGGGGLDLHAGEVFSVEALLYALLLDSSNDAAVALAEHVAGSHEAFVERMDGYVAALGATGTDHVTAHGLDMPGHGSTANDLALIATELLADPLLADIVATSNAAIEGPKGTIPLENRNLLLEGYRGATGVKTGFTAGAGNMLVASATRGGRTLIAVVMHSVDATADAAALLDYGWSRLAESVVLREGTSVGALVFDQGSTPVIAATPVKDPALPADVDYEFLPDATIEVPIATGDVVGRVVVTSPRGTIATVDAVAVRDVVPPEEGSWAVDLCAGLLRAVGGLVGGSR